MLVYCRNVSDSSGGVRRKSKTGNSSTSSTPVEQRPSNVTIVSQQLEQQLNLSTHELPDGVCDFDRENWDDIFQVSHYAMDIFNYLKSREVDWLFNASLNILTANMVFSRSSCRRIT